MTINWKLRFQNKATLLALVGLVTTFIYQVLGLCGVVPAVGETAIENVIALFVDILVAIGIVVDPTTSGVGDSTRALSYDKPNEG